MPCKACGFIPLGDERPVAWLFGDDYLSEEELAEAAERIRGGELPDPGRALQQMAREAMGAVRIGEDQKPLVGWELLAIAVVNLLLTPLFGLAIWYGLREERPVAARQAARMTAPIAVALGLVWGAVLVMKVVS